jgi:hypothetical protein
MPRIFLCGISNLDAKRLKASNVKRQPVHTVLRAFWFRIRRHKGRGREGKTPHISQFHLHIIVVQYKRGLLGRPKTR